MKKIKELSLLVFLLTFIIIVSVWTTSAAAEGPKYDLSKMKQRQVPAYCGDTGFMFETSLELFNELPIAGAEVRTAGMPDAPIIGIITLTYNEDRGSGTVMMTIPAIGETCVLAYGMNWQFYNEIHVEGNESK
tara:strand:+ start:58624 stop:59022 length:399 start_codon:yes stop_codon:yes gene_type:complete